MRMPMRSCVLAAAIAALAVHPRATQAQQPASWLSVWTGAADSPDSAVLAVIDARPGGPT